MNVCRCFLTPPSFPGFKVAWLMKKRRMLNLAFAIVHYPLALAHFIHHRIEQEQPRRW